ncbi:hypothetical protein [Amycolatopsis sp. CA-230715]|uniref:hypothetical protein n=1 Tax=Amycolatopsis sp. CA-230715 TaxID=2745196 RepID=UPI001C00BA52|nr:hypothetical protein [Amycolatopsis sp. CA-230715]QWF80991.1 hypothetical protein HUW46_04416 [Amycolatopsis sp. CA-230715]
MFDLVLSEHARGTPVETLYKLVGASGLIITVCGPHDPADTTRAIIRAAPRLLEDHDDRTDGLVMSRVGMYRIFWGVVGFRGGSLALLVPSPAHEQQDYSDWTRHFMAEVLDPVMALSGEGYSTGGGGDGFVTDAEFARAFNQVSV